MVPGIQSADKEMLQQKINRGAGWFGAISLLSFVNAVILICGYTINFVLGVAITTLISVLAKNASMGGKAIILLIDALISGIWYLFAIQGRKGQAWAFIIGIVFYTIDGLIYLAAGDFLPAGFHVYALIYLCGGAKACFDLKKLNMAEYSQAAMYGTGGQPNVQGSWPPSPNSLPTYQQPPVSYPSPMPETPDLQSQTYAQQPSELQPQSPMQQAPHMMPQASAQEPQKWPPPPSSAMKQQPLPQQPSSATPSQDVQPQLPPQQQEDPSQTPWYGKRD